MTNQRLMQRDLAVLWHPCTQMHDHEQIPIVPIAKAQRRMVRPILMANVILMPLARGGSTFGDTLTHTSTKQLKNSSTP
jgi:hypothetical protein